MYKSGGSLTCSPTDLTVFLESEFASWMDRWHADQSTGTEHNGDRKGNGNVSKSPSPVLLGGFPCCRDDEDESLALIARKGNEHELAFLTKLKAEGLTIAEIARGDEAFEQTLAALKQGVPIVFQARLQMDGWAGYADFLAKRDGKSKLGSHHYEIWDTKLARSAKPYFLVQLCAYAEMLEQLQGVRPAEVEIVLGSGERKRFITNNFFYYFRELKRAFTKFQKSFDPSQLPDPGLSKSYGRWTKYAEQILSAADHLSFVARMTRSQIKKLNDAGVTTMSGLAGSKEQYITGLSKETVSRLIQQAKLQLESRSKKSPTWAVVAQSPDDPRRGLALLPPPSKNDIYFDMEGYPLAEGGLEYLFGAVYVGKKNKMEFWDAWAHDAISEKTAFETFIDWAFARWEKDPTLHIYHYAGYEVMAVRKLMGKYATREQQVDDLLRSQVFVDLYAVVRQGILVGTRSYSLKEIEKLYMTRPEGGVMTAGGSVVAYQNWLDLQDGETWKESQILAEIRDYNRVDCESLVGLCDWLRLRQVESKVAYISEKEEEAQESGDGEPISVKPSTALSEKLLKQIERGEVTEPEKKRVQELLAWLLEFHWREAKPVWWRMFDRHEMTEAELVDDADCIGGMERTKKPRVQVKRSWDYQYRFDPDQDTKLHEGSSCYFAHDLTVKCEITSFDADTGLLNIKLGPRAAEPPARLNLIPDEYVSAQAIADVVYRYVDLWSQGQQVSRAVDDLVHRRLPRIKQHAGGPIVPAGAGLDAIVNVAARLDESTICIQGPPGTGKTFTAAAIIVELVKQGKSVGITATSHKCILNAMHAVAKAADEKKVKVTLIKSGDDDDDPLVQSGRIKNIQSNAAAGFLGGAPVVLGGTAWLFSRPDLVGRLDYLIIDEAGQFCLANVVATGQAAKNIILVGDQMQLGQPIQGSHPGESGKSGLEYLLQGKATVPPEQGIFLDLTWRMHPHICSFISNAVYEGRLKPHPDAGKQEVQCPKKHGGFERACGVVYMEVNHQFNSQCSDEEVEAIDKIVKQLVGRCVVGRDGKTSDLTLADILIVAPYNMQVRRLKAKLGPNARVGSVDKFQGQEAAVVIVSMCASSIEECPRGIEFVLNKNRINVAVSRAKCLAIVVGCREIMASRCSTIEQMEMTNLYCWLAAHAEEVPAVAV